MFEGLNEVPGSSKRTFVSIITDSLTSRARMIHSSECTAYGLVLVSREV
jgi:hypothetical protein